MDPTEIESQRDEVQEILSGIEGVAKVYFQPPSSQRLTYPCIVYSLNKYNTKYSNNSRYLTYPEYTVTLIDSNPESIIQKRIMDLNGSCFVGFDRFYTSDNLNHWVYTLIYSSSLW